MDVDAAGPSDLPVSWDRRGANHGRNDWRSALMRRPEGSAGRSEQVLFSRACGSRSRRRLRARLRRDSIQAVRDEGDDRLAQIETGVSEPRHRPVAVQFAEWHPPIRAAFSVEGKYDRGVPVRRNVGEPVVEGRLSTKAEPVRANKRRHDDHQKLREKPDGHFRMRSRFLAVRSRLRRSDRLTQGPS